MCDRDRGVAPLRVQREIHGAQLQLLINAVKGLIQLHLQLIARPRNQSLLCTCLEHLGQDVVLLAQRLLGTRHDIDIRLDLPNLAIILCQLTCDLEEAGRGR